jgi:hypothetical protein
MTNMCWSLFFDYPSSTILLRLSFFDYPSSTILLPHQSTIIPPFFDINTSFFTILCVVLTLRPIHQTVLPVPTAPCLWTPGISVTSRFGRTPSSFPRTVSSSLLLNYPMEEHRRRSEDCLSFVLSELYKKPPPPAPST